MRSNALSLSALLASLTLSACAGSPTEPTPPAPPSAPVYRAQIGYAICSRAASMYTSRLPTRTDSTGSPRFRLDSAGVPVVGAAVTWVSRDTAIYAPGPGGSDRAGRVGAVWIVGTARGVSDSVPVRVVASVETDCG